MTTNNTVLTDEEIVETSNSADFESMVTADDFIFVVARAIEQAVLAKVQPVPAGTWISVKDRLPDTSDTVIVYTPPQPDDYPDSMRIDFDRYEDGTWSSHADQYDHYIMIGGPDLGPGPGQDAPYTHWMPMPKRPSEPTAVSQDADPLQSAADWLFEAIEDLTAADIQGRLCVGHNRANNLLDAARSRDESPINSKHTSLFLDACRRVEGESC